jgi:hypothetical protein
MGRGSGDLEHILNHMYKVITSHGFTAMASTTVQE